MKLNEAWISADPRDVNPRKTPRRSRKPLEAEIISNGRTLLTVKRAAEKAGVTISTIYRWNRAGILPHFRAGYFIRIDQMDLNSLLSRIG